MLVGLLRNFGRLLQHWPTLVAAASELRGRSALFVSP
jgi:hypothetical protein